MSLRSARPDLPSLTGIRFIAAFLVVLFHINIELRTFSSLRSDGIPALAHGYIGVSLFFVLSGFILTYTYIQPDQTLRGNRVTFWQARLARVYPVYLFALLVSLPLFIRRIMTPNTMITSSVDMALSTLFTPALLQAWWPRTACQWNCAGWSLSVEALFYAVFPLLGVWLARQSSKRLCATTTVIWLASLAPPLLYLAVDPDGAQHVTESAKSFWLMGLKYNPVLHLGEFTVGIVTGLLFLRRSEHATARMASAPLVIAVFAAIVALVPETVFPYPLLHTGVLAPLFGLLIYSLACRDSLGAETLVNRTTMVRLGACSYALYLLHPSIIAYSAVSARHLGLQGPVVYAVFAGSLIFSIMVSTVVFDRVEEPARRWLRARAVQKTSLAQSVAPAP